MLDSIKPGSVWLDTEGKRIQAHGGSIITVGDMFFWYGENKERTTGQDDIWHWGVRCYSSADLYNWKDEGIIIPPEPDDPTSPLNPTAFMDRPHILYCAGTQRYVAWLKIMGHPSYFAVLSSESILGPYRMENPAVRPAGRSVGDFDLQVDAETGEAYLISQLPHTAVYIMRLNDSYTDVAGEPSDHFLHVAPPEAREAPAHFVRNGKHYLITSGTTGYHPNPSEVAVSDSWMGPYAVQGNLCPADASLTTWNSQVSSVFKYPGKRDLYIAVADRWRPDLPVTEGAGFATGEAFRAFSSRFVHIFNPATKFVPTQKDLDEMRINSSVADYVWLPLVFEGDRVEMPWRDEWRIEDYD